MSTRRVLANDSQGIAAAIAAGEKFQTSTGSLSGGPVRIGNASRLGVLPDHWRQRWHDALAIAKSGPSREVYAVWSYETPIAWQSGGRWTMPDVRYSVTTSKHLGTVRRAIASIDPGPACYYIGRSYRDRDHRRIVLSRGLTLAEAQAHCSDPETSSRTATSAEARRRTAKYGPWFDYYESAR